MNSFVRILSLDITRCLNYFSPKCTLRRYKQDFNVKKLCMRFSVSCSANCLTYVQRSEFSHFLQSIALKNVTCKGETHFRNFRTSAKMDVHPYLWVVLRPVFKFIAVLTGRGFRKWWQNLPPNKRRYFWGVLKKNKIRLSVIIGTTGSLAFVYYENHLQETPITKRKRFIVFTEDQCKQIADFELKLHVEKLRKNILPKHHPVYARVVEVAQKLLDANKDIEEIFNKKWTITVIDNPEENAFAFPNGSIFVFTGMLNICSNNDQLACVIAHELAHCILGHAGDQISFAHFVDYVAVMVLAAIWAILPSDFVAMFTHWLFNKFVEVLVNLPYQRSLETEADEVGIQLSAKACFDVRESSAFWAKMSIISQTIPDIDFLSTHPSHEKRSIHLDNLMNEALDLRKSCGCPSLKSHDPRLDIVAFVKVTEDMRRQNCKKLVAVQASSVTTAGVAPS